jgi:5'-nucleotidase
MSKYLDCPVEKMLMKSKIGGRASYIREIFILFCLQVSIALCFNLTILHTNDIHGRFEETDKHGFTCDPNKEACFGGVARIATAVKEVRSKEENVVFVDGADRFTGTIWSEVYKGNASKVFFNELNYTAIVSIKYINILSCNML